MSWCKTSIIFISALIFFGCASSTPVEVEKVQSVKPTYKSIEGENLFILQALQYEQNMDLENSYRTFRYLYEQTQNPEYLKEIVSIGFVLDQDISEFLQKALEIDGENEDILRVKAGVLAKNGEYDEAKDIMVRLIQNDKSPQNMYILASLYFHLKEYEKSLEYYELIYQQEQDEDTLLMIVDLLDNYMNKKAEALAYLETVTRLNECTKGICHRLVQIYGKNRNVAGLISTYKKLYDRYEEDEYAQKYIELLLFQNDTNQAIEFLRFTNYNPRLLMDLLGSQKRFKEAYDVAQNEYEKSKNPHFLGLMAIYEYEQNRDNITKDALKSVSQKFENSLKMSEESLFLNYYGYLLIDHDIDYKKGVELVKKALKLEPNSHYYIDSLAWGYFKLGDCKKAYEIIEPISKLEDEELVYHLNEIKKCLEKDKN